LNDTIKLVNYHSSQYGSTDAMNRPERYIYQNNKETNAAKPSSVNTASSAASDRRKSAREKYEERQKEKAVNNPPNNYDAHSAQNEQLIYEKETDTEGADR
jgi:hypothetical protein